MKNLLTLAMLCISLMMNAQTASSLKVFLKPVNADGTELQTRDKAVLMSDETHNSVTLVVSAENVETATKLHIRLGDTEGGAEKLELTINADGTDLPAGVTLSKKDGKFYIGVGNHNHMVHFYAEVKIEDAAGVGPAIEYNK